MMEKLIDRITQFGYRGAFACALVLSLIGLMGTFGAVAESRRGRAWRGWIAWWAGTAAYYALQLLFPAWGLDARWWIPQLALDGATLALLVALVDVDKAGRLAWYVGFGVVVLGARVADVAIVRKHQYAFVHQLVDVLVFLAWAWRARMEIKEAVAIAIYGLAQFPLPALLANAGVDPGRVDAQLLQMTAQYAIAKPVLLLALVPFLRTLSVTDRAVATVEKGLAGRPAGQ